MASRLNQQFGNYRLIRHIDTGGFAEVYLGEHIHLGTQAAIKVQLEQLPSRDKQKFYDEARNIAHLKHPHIVRLLEFGVEKNTPFMVMDYASHGTLEKRHPLGTQVLLPTVISYTKQIASGSASNWLAMREEKMVNSQQEGDTHGKRTKRSIAGVHTASASRDYIGWQKRRVNVWIW